MRTSEIPLWGVIGEPTGDFVPIIGPVLRELQPWGELEAPSDEQLLNKLASFAQKLREAGIRDIIPTGAVTLNLGDIPNSRATRTVQQGATVETFIGIKSQ